eukprot:Phypoly_transcript_13897.p1 GENE.Phypoly_transcript_13897~~Phypoly_transcript_13897.p1  ORF type:complete len:304 (+),score=34.00 Phypoly_transcript_13897:75-986(+)
MSVTEAYPTFDAQMKNDVTIAPYKYLAEIPGKEVRSMLVNCFNKWLAIEPEQLKKITEIIQMLHNASLLIDDIEDNSKMRRGVPVAHAIYGIPSTINCANYVYFLAMEHCRNLGSQEALTIFLEELLSLHRGQGFDIYWRDNLKCPSEEEYIDMVSAKTGGLFRLAVRLMQAFSENKSDFIPLVNELGLFFQVRDDYMNLQSDQYHQHKSFCEDLTEGKFSFPIIHAIHQDPNDHRLVNILKQKPESVEVKAYAVEYMKKQGSFEYTKKIMEQYKNRAIQKVSALGGNEELAQLVEKLWTSIP